LFILSLYFLFLFSTLFLFLLFSLFFLPTNVSAPKKSVPQVHAISTLERGIKQRAFHAWGHGS
jgi:hypothetical protein